MTTAIAGLAVYGPPVRARERILAMIGDNATVRAGSQLWSGRMVRAARR